MSVSSSESENTETTHFGSPVSTTTSFCSHCHSPTSPTFPSKDYAPRFNHQREQTLLGSDPTCLPPVTAGRKRTLILCFDGTGDSFDKDISNIASIFSMLKKDDKSVQMCYYQAGIGTYTSHHIGIPGMLTLTKAVDQAVAWLLGNHVKEGYEFLMQNYAVGDKICLFGFSRGAYTARALAGMLHKVGLLPKDNKQQIPFAWKMYKDETEDGWKLSRQFKDAFCADVNIEFIGVFDTVSSVGILGQGLPFTSSNSEIKYFRHAMALDERRARFKVNHWHATPTRPGKNTDNTEKKSVRRGHEHEWKDKHDVVTDVKEVWFAGAHCDVGGGNVLNDTPHSLARIPLRWMVRETFRCNVGILWDLDGLKRIGLDPDMLYPRVISHSHSRINSIHSEPSSIHSDTKSSPPTTPTFEEKEEEQDVMDYSSHPEHDDATSPMFDYLELAKTWWILEVLPTKGKMQIDANEWCDHYFINLGRPRVVPKMDSGMLVHHTVKMRQRKDEKYKIQAIFDGEPVWVD